MARCEAFAQQLRVFQPLVAKPASDEATSSPTHLDLKDILGQHRVKLQEYPVSVILPQAVIFFKAKAKDMCESLKAPLTEIAGGEKAAHHEEWVPPLVLDLDDDNHKIQLPAWKVLRCRTTPARELLKIQSAWLANEKAFDASFKKFGPQAKSPREYMNEEAAPMKIYETCCKVLGMPCASCRAEVVV